MTNVAFLLLPRVGLELSECNYCRNLWIELQRVFQERRVYAYVCHLRRYVPAIDMHQRTHRQAGPKFLASWEGM